MIVFFQGFFENLSLKLKWNECVHKRTTNFSKTNRTVVCNIAANIQYFLTKLIDTIRENTM